MAPTAQPAFPHVTTTTAPRFGTVAIVGRPNVGKSTLLNALVGEKVAIVSPRPGTTRDRILGVLTRPDAQIAFLDTPGFGTAPTLLDRRLLQVARSAWAEAEVVVVVTDASAGITEADRRLLTALPSGPKAVVRPSRGAIPTIPVLVALNKIDRVAKPKLLPQMEALATLVPTAEVIPICAATGDGLPELLAAVVAQLPPGRPLYPPDYLTDHSTRFLAAELIREQILLVVREELPHAVAVQIEEFRQRGKHTTRRVRGHERRGPSQPITYIRATILVERPSQKGIIVGAHGERLKAIGTAARPALEQLVDQPVYLDLWVKVSPRWREQPQALKSLGY